MPKTREKVFSVSIKDCKVEAIASTGGGGGQNKNRRHTAIRITHEPSGAVGFSADERDQLRNKHVAWSRMARKDVFQRWCRVEASRRSGKKTIDQEVEDMLDSSNLRIETKDASGKWVELENE